MKIEIIKRLTKMRKQLFTKVQIRTLGSESGKYITLSKNIIKIEMILTMLLQQMEMVRV